MKIRYLILTFLLAIVSPIGAVTPGEVLAKVKGKIINSKGLSGNFSISSPNGKGSGSFLFDGKRSHVSSPSFGSSWYDGKSMWSLNPRSKEVTVVTPTLAEVRDANPLMYLNSIESEFRLFFSKRKENGKYILLLNPKQSGTGVKAIEIIVDAASYLPQRITVRDKNDVRSNVSLSGLNFNKKVQESDFKFDSSRYPGYEVIDLR